MLDGEGANETELGLSSYELPWSTSSQISSAVAAAAAKSFQSCLTLLPRPWDSPGKNTGVGCHFHLQFMKVKSESEVA